MSKNRGERRRLFLLVTVVFDGVLILSYEFDSNKKVPKTITDSTRQISK